MESNIASRLDLNGLELSVKLGWPEDERVYRQLVTVDIGIVFLQAPEGCLTDNLSDTYCYDALVNTIKNKIAEGEFRLVEHLCYKIYQTIKAILPAENRINVSVKKIPPIENLTGGVRFCYGDMT